MFLHLFQLNTGVYMDNQEFVIEKIQIRNKFIMQKTTDFIYTMLYIIGHL